ncbi:uncharacterized protein K02A2.6 [Spinachia spinachia]
MGGIKERKERCRSYKSDKKLYTYSSKEPLSVKGVFTCGVKIGKRETMAEFIVIAGQGVPLLGREIATKLGVLNVGVDVAAVTDVKAEVRGKYPKLFTRVGKLNTKQIGRHINDNVEPIAQPLRRIPFHLREAVDKKIEELLGMDIIEKVEGATPWVNPVVVVPKAKDTDIRLCADMRMANKAIIWGIYQIPTVDELLHDMKVSVVFSKLDLKWGYHPILEESRAKTTFAVHHGTYRYKRLIFGVSSASEQYQHEVATPLAGIEGVANISDDIILHAPDRETHDKRLHAELERLEKCGPTLNGEKCQFEMDKLVFMGILLSEKGIGPTSERVRALVEGRQPETASEVRSFLGLARYSSRFIRQFAAISEPLQRLTKKDVPFVFGRNRRWHSSHLRIERWVLRLQPYNFQVIHIAGKYNITDPLSRLLGDTAKKRAHQQGAEEYMRFVAVQATPMALTSRGVERASADNEELSGVRKAIQTGRFEKCSAYSRIANELCTIGQLVLRGTRIVLPHAVRISLTTTQEQTQDTEIGSIY